MLYYSEILKKPFNNEKDCLLAEKKYKEEQQTAIEAENKKKVEISKRKKELSTVIDIAENRVTEAYKKYDLAKEKAAKLLEESNKQVNEILLEAEREVKEAEKEKRNALVNFTNEFGTYSKTYTGKEAEDEMEKAIKSFPSFTSIIDRFLSNLF